MDEGFTQISIKSPPYILHLIVENEMKSWLAYLDTMSFSHDRI